MKEPSRNAEIGAQSVFSERSLLMTLKQLKLIAIIIPFIVTVSIEVTRTMLLGNVELWKRLVLDGMTVAGLFAFSAVIFRVLGKIQERLEHRNRELLALHAAGLHVASELSLEIVLNKVVEQAKNLVGAKYGALSVIDRDGNIKEFITSGVTTEERAAIGPPPVGHGVLAVTLIEGQHLRLANVAEHPRSAGFPPNHPVMRSLLAVPVTCKSPFLGNIYLSEKLDGSPFTADDEETLERFAVQASIAIDNAHLHAQVEEIATARERLRIAHEMHDGIAQVLGYVNTKVQAAKQYFRLGKTEEGNQQLEQLAASARQAYSDVRESIVGLRTLPGSDRSLADVLGEFLGHWKDQSGIEAELTIDSALRLPVSVELQIVRIIQESLTNVRKHARATKARVDVHRHDGQLVVSIHDDGGGFNPEATARGEFPKFGLTTMRERASSILGSLEIESAAGEGTTVRFTMPLAAAANV